MLWLLKCSLGVSVIEFVSMMLFLIYIFISVVLVLDGWFFGLVFILGIVLLLIIFRESWLLIELFRVFLWYFVLNVVVWLKLFNVKGIFYLVFVVMFFNLMVVILRLLMWFLLLFVEFLFKWLLDVFLYWI